MKRISIASVFLVAFFIFSPSAGIADQNIENAPSMALRMGNANQPSNTMGAVKGCATGAVAGSVMPGLGNVIGCIAGGIFGWFW